VSFRCFVDTFDVLSTKEQLVDESLEEAFLGGTQIPRPIFFSSIRSEIKCFCLIKKKVFGHGVTLSPSES
jgi:hypothetical protein